MTFVFAYFAKGVTDHNIHDKISFFCLNIIFWISVIRAKMFHPGYLYWVLCLLKLIQSNVVDKILNFLFGFTTLNGWNADIKKSKMEFESSAQV